MIKKFNKVLSILLVLVLSISLLFVYTGADDVIPEEPVVQEETTTEPETSADMSLMDAVHTGCIGRD